MLEENTVQYVSAQEITKQILMIICTIIAIVFISTGIIHSLQQTSEFQITFSLDPNFDFNFDTALYYCVVTMLTIGYGDLVPDTRYTRLIISLMLIMVIVLLTSQTSSLSDLLKRSSRYVRPYKGERGGHIVVVGTYTPTTLYRFLREFYHPDHKLDMKTCKVVLIGNDAPTKELYRIINNPYYESAVFYIQGDFLTEATIKNANLPKSRGVFILSDQYTEQSNNVDTYTILASSCVKEYSPDTKVYLQLVKPDLMIHNYWAGWEIGFSTWSIKVSILAANIFVPGFGTMMSNLVTSTMRGINKENENSYWMNEYIIGISNEIYMIPIPEHLYGIEFTKIVKNLFLKHNSLLIGVETCFVNIDAKRDEDYIYEILLNPVSYIIRPGDKAFIIASDVEDARAVQKLELIENSFLDLRPSLTAHLNLIESPAIKRSYSNQHDRQYFVMFESDLRGEIWNHILVFGQFEHFEIILQVLNKLSDQIVCFVSDKTPDGKWLPISKKFPNAMYLQCTLTDLEEVSRTAINFAYHAVIFSSKIPGSSLEDSASLSLIRMIEQNFSCKFTVELVDERNLIYLDNKPPTYQNIPYLVWPRYAASNVFFSSSLEYILAQSYHNNHIVDIIQRMICYEDLYAEFNIDENYRMNAVDIPSQLCGEVTFGDIFCYFLNKTRPVIVLGIYRGEEFLNNETPYMYTKPDMNAPIFEGDKLIIMGETQSREFSPLIKLQQKRNKIETLELGSIAKSATKAYSSVIIRKVTKVDIALQSIVDDEVDANYVKNDRYLVDSIFTHLANSESEREILLVITI
jgi:hypothetical protein